MSNRQRLLELRASQDGIRPGHPFLEIVRFLRRVAWPEKVRADPTLWVFNVAILLPTVTNLQAGQAKGAHAFKLPLTSATVTQTFGTDWTTSAGIQDYVATVAACWILLKI